MKMLRFGMFIIGSFMFYLLILTLLAGFVTSNFNVMSYDPIGKSIMLFIASYCTIPTTLFKDTFK